MTGCAGFIGSHLTEGLLGGGAEVVGVDCFNDNYGRAQKLQNLSLAREWDGFDFVPLDLALGDLADLVEDADVVFHLAAEPGVRPSWGAAFERYTRNNVLATQHLLEAVRATPEKRFVYASSSSIYGQAETLPTHEDMTPMPYSPYGVTKLAGEHLCQLYHRNFELSTVVLRYFTVFGPRQRPDMAFSRFCRAARDRTRVDVFGDGQQTRDFTYVGDAVAATIAAGTRAAIDGQVFNIGGGVHASVNETLTLLTEIAGCEIDVRREPRQHGDVRDTSADTTRARRLLGFEPATGLRDGLSEQWSWMTAVALR